jgi:outer membrane protein TolC
MLTMYREIRYKTSLFLVLFCQLFNMAVYSQGQTQTTTPQQPAQPTQNVGVSPEIPEADLPQQPPTVAEGFEAQARPLPSAERIGVDVNNQTPLTLFQAISLALENNNDIDASRIDARIAEFDFRSAQGAYDPRLSTESYFERRETPVGSFIGGGTNGSVTTTDTTGNLSLEGLSPWGGGSYRFQFSSSRSTTNNQFTALNPQFPSSATFTFTQPLWRGLRTDDNRRRVEIARKNLTLTDAQFRQRAIEVITQVQQAYWDLVFALRNLQVQIDAVKQARLQVDSNRRMVQQGILAPIDIVAAETQVTTFEQNVYTAQEGVARAENRLKTLCLPDRSNRLWTEALLPVTSVDLHAPRVDLSKATEEAFRNRFEIAQLQTTAEINEINRKFFKDQTRPQIDLVGTYGSTGLAGEPVPRDSNPFSAGNELLQQRVNEISALLGLAQLPSPSIGNAISEDLIGGYNTSIGNLAAQKYPVARVGVRLSIPLRNRTAEANFGRTLAEGVRIKNQRDDLEQKIEAEVRNSLQSLRSAEARLQAAAAARSSAEKQFESEQRKFQAGTSTVFLVLQRQTELVNARGREIQGQVDLNKAIADFQRATGNTLSANNVMVRGDLSVALKEAVSQIR